YNVNMSGDCFSFSVGSGFTGPWNTDEIDYYQYGPGQFTNPPTPFTNNSEVSFDALPDATELTLVSTDFGTSPGPNLFFFNGVEWKNESDSDAEISFNWTYNTVDGPAWDHFVYMIGNDAQNFANSNFGNQLNLWTIVQNQAGGLSQ